jgi:general secretion pathway protein J
MIAARKTEAGFTLVEMLVALALLGLAAMLMLEGVGATQRLWSGEAARTRRGESVEAAQSILRARIERLRPATRFDGPNAFADVDGRTRELVFVAPPGEAEGAGAARRFRLTLSDQGELVLGAAGSVDAAGAPVYSDQVLLRDVGGLEISYYGSDPSGGSAHWQSDWSRRASPPQAVRIALALKDGDTRVWPELIIHPAAAVDTLCAIDPATGDCRGRT